MKGISTVIASILMLVIVIALGGTTYLYISDTFSGKIATSFEVIDSINDTVTIRNSGTEPIMAFSSATVDGTSAVYRVSTRDPSLVGYWKMDEGSWTNDCLTNTVMDSSGNENRGKSCPIGTGPIGGAVGKFGNAGNFDGVDDYVDMGNPVVLQNMAEGTIAVWFKRQATSGTYQMIFTDSSSKLEITFSANTLQFYINNAGISKFLPTLDVWYHVVGTWSISGNFQKLYVSAVEVDSRAPTGNTGSITRYIGSRGGSFPFNGLIDEVRVFNRALSESEIKAEFNIGSQIDPTETATVKIYNTLTKGTHTLRLCTSGICNTAYLTIN